MTSDLEKQYPSSDQVYQVEQSLMHSVLPNNERMLNKCRMENNLSIPNASKFFL
jgi:hypothetical protein